MSELYKLTDQDMRTYGGFQWRLKEPSNRLPDGGKLCSKAFYHAYLSPELAVLLNPIHANFQQPRLFLADGEISLRDRQLKVGCKQLTLLEELHLPSLTLTQRIAFGILAAKAVYKNLSFQKWADDWLNNKDRTLKAAHAAAYAAYAADAAAYAADAAAYAARAADAADAACAAYAAYAAAYAARAAARAAVHTAEVDLIHLSKECLRY